MLYTYNTNGNRVKTEFVCANTAPVPATAIAARVNKTIFGDSSTLLFSKKEDPAPVGAKETSVFQALSIFPNPTTGPVTIRMTAELKPNAIMILRAMNGLVIAQARISGFQVTGSLETQPAGMYLIEIIDGQQRIVQKILKLLKATSNHY